MQREAKTSREAGTSPKPGQICSYLEWDSKFFGRRIARLEQPRLDENKLDEALAWCRENAIDCLYFLADAAHFETVRLAQSSDFLLSDVRMTLARPISEADRGESEADGIRAAREQDLAALRAIARTAHRDSRFYFDEHFDRNKCDLLYETWIENSFRGFAQAVLVAEVDGQSAAYLTCQLRGAESQIGLVGVGAGYQGKGIGSKLVRHFLAWSCQRGAKRGMVVTQGRNLAAQRLYQACGFLSESLELWYHRWFQR